MAKKTSYLKELIERHERWKAEGGEKLEDEEHDAVSELPSGSDAEDLWDFGTVRNTARAGTVGRAQQNPIHVSGPPLTWENDSSSRPGSSPVVTSTRRGSGSSISSMKSSLSAKGELPPLPPSTSSTPSKYSDHQATVRNLPSSGIDPAAQSTSAVRREPSDEYEDYGDQYVDGYQGNSKIVQEDDLPDTTMLDSVILPAIASLFPRVSTQEARVALSALQRAFTEAERIIPGVTTELVNEIVDSVEHVDDVR